MKSLEWLVLCFVFPLFFLGGPDYYSPRLFTELWNLGHFFFFVLFISLLDGKWCSKRRSILFRLVASFFAVVFVGLTIELIQLGVVDRSFAWSDVLGDLSGGGVALLWRISSSVPPIQSISYRAVLIIILLINFMPLAEIVLDEYRAYKDFPLLAGFESKYELHRWNGDAGLRRDAYVSQQGSYSGKIRLTTNQYSGIFLRHFPGDWSKSRGLAFSVFNPGRKLKLHYLVHDVLYQSDKQIYTDRFSGRTVIDNGWNEIVIPMDDILYGPQGRTMDLTKIRGFGVFVIRQDTRHILYLDNVRLL